MLTTTLSKLISTTTLLLIAFIANGAYAQVDPSTKYQLHGQITLSDQAKRQLTIETTTFKKENNKDFLSIERKVYDVAVGVKLLNMPKAVRYTGLKNLPAGTLVYFNLKRGTEKNNIPTIAEMWVELQ